MACNCGLALDPHRHQHVKRAVVGMVADNGGGGGVSQREFGRIALNLLRDVEQIAGVEPDLHRVCAVLYLYLFIGGARVGVGGREHDVPTVDGKLHGPGFLGGDGGDPVDGGLEGLAVDNQRLFVPFRDDPLIIGEGAVDKLGRQFNGA